jgi:hypothetical protein
MADDTPFDSIESAHEYVTLLTQQVEEVTASLAEDLELASREGEARHLDALRLVDLKLRQLGDHLTRSRRILNDLRALRRLLLTERTPLPTSMTGPTITASTIEPFEETTLMESDSAAPFSIRATPKHNV